MSRPDYARFGAAVAGRLDVYVREDDVSPTLTLSGLLDIAAQYGVTIGDPEADSGAANA